MIDVVQDSRLRDDQSLYGRDGISEQLSRTAHTVVDPVAQ